MKKFWIILVAIAALVLVGAPANATGSDGVPPYDVGKEGITLPEGDSFPAHGHINLKYTDFEGNNEQSAGIHFDPNNGHPGGQWIGESFIPWSAFGLTDNWCLSWVQIHGYNQHYGEGPHKELCIPPVDPCVEDPFGVGCEVPPAPEAWHKTEERTNPLVCEPGNTGFGTVTTESREGTKNPVWVETEWAWVLPVDWTWADWEVESEERVESELCEPLPEVGSTLNPWYLGAGFGFLVLGSAVMFARRREAV